MLLKFWPKPVTSPLKNSQWLPAVLFLCHEVLNTVTEVIHKLSSSLTSPVTLYHQFDLPSGFALLILVYSPVCLCLCCARTGMLLSHCLSHKCVPIFQYPVQISLPLKFLLTISSKIVLIFPYLYFCRTDNLNLLWGYVAINPS